MMSTTEQQTKIFQHFNGTVYVPNSMDVQTGALWDCLHLEPGQTFTNGPTYQMFSIPYGKPGPFAIPSIKTIADTNMIQACKLDAPEAFSIDRVTFTFSRDTLDKDLYTFAEQTVWEFWLGKKRYLWAVLISLPTVKAPIAPLRICDFCAGVYVAAHECPGCGAREFSLTTFGGVTEPGMQFTLDVNPHVVIDNQTSFYTMFQGGPILMTGKLKLWVHLHGLHARGVC